MSGEKVQSLSAEQAQDLAALEMAAQEAAAQSAAAVHQEQQAAAAVVSLSAEIAGALKIMVSVARPMFPSLTEIYTEETISAVSESVGAVCQKHGWLGGGLFGEWGEEIACAVVCLPVAFATYTGIKSDIAAKGKKIHMPKPEKPAEESPGSGSKSVQVGTVIPDAGEL